MADRFVPTFLAAGYEKAAQQAAEEQAKSAGFASVAAQDANRQMRNQLEMKAQMAGMPVQEAYNLVQGDLTNTKALQEAWNKIPAQYTPPAAPAPAAAPAPEAPKGPTQADIYNQQREDFMSAADAILKGIQDEYARQQQAMETARKLQIQSQATMAANMARAGQTPNLQIQPASGTPQTAGTQSFRRRSTQFAPTTAAGSVLAGLNLGQTGMVNV